MRGKPSRPSTWLETGVLPLLGALMWATWLAFPIDALLAFVTDQRASGGAGPAAMALLLGGTMAARVAQPTRSGRWLVAVTGLGEKISIAPHTHLSGCSHRVTTDQPLRLEAQD